jgi:hypothetical protein
MRLYAQRRLIAGTALLAFLFAVAFPALAVMRQAVDPLAFAKICRIDTGVVVGDNGVVIPGSPQEKLKAAQHCLMCVGTGNTPPQMVVATIVISAVPELLLPIDRRPVVVSDPAVLQPLNPRAPPRA